MRTRVRFLRAAIAFFLLMPAMVHAQEDIKAAERCSSPKANRSLSEGSSRKGRGLDNGQLGATAAVHLMAIVRK
jgi:hypothetical protein